MSPGFANLSSRVAEPLGSPAVASVATVDRSTRADPESGPRAGFRPAGRSPPHRARHRWSCPCGEAAFWDWSFRPPSVICRTNGGLGCFVPSAGRSFGAAGLGGVLLLLVPARLAAL